MTILILGAGESGLGSALLAKKNNYNVFISDAGGIHDSTKENLINELNKLLLNEKIQKKQIKDLKEFNMIMNKDINDPSENATRIISKILEN